MSDDPLDQELEKLEAQGPRFIGLSDGNVRPALILLTRAVLRLDKTSSRLTKIVIGLTVVGALVALLQLAVMVVHR
jgi:hypothetical protein